jgi:hypothetical protein
MIAEPPQMTKLCLDQSFFAVMTRSSDCGGALTRWLRVERWTACMKMFGRYTRGHQRAQCGLAERVAHQ